MRQEEVTKILQELELPKNKYIHTKKIKSIKLKSGREIKFNWEFLRICFQDKLLKVRYGNSELYGGRIESVSFISANHRAVACSVKNGKIETSYRQPKELDVLVVSKDKKILSRAYITKIVSTLNQNVYYLSGEVSPEGRFSFYDPDVYLEDGSCIHGTEFEGIYTKFKPNLESISKKEIVHEIISYKEIKEIIIEGQV
jgi:hypothetical protein